LFGKVLLGRVPESAFRRVVSALLIALGVALLVS